MKTLMTPNEVIKFSGVALPFNPCSFQELYTIEFDQARRCIGMDLWNAMVAAKADYSASPAYASGTTYNLNDTVKFQGLVYQVIVASTTALPTVVTDWSLAPKFTGDCAATYEDFFCLFLAPYLAKKILHIRLPYIRTKITDLGTLNYGDSRQETADKKDFVSLQNAIGRDQGIAWRNLQFWMNEDAQKENECLAGYLEYQKEDCDATNTCKEKQHRVGIYRFG